VLRPNPWFMVRLVAAMVAAFFMLDLMRRPRCSCMENLPRCGRRPNLLLSSLQLHLWYPLLVGSDEGPAFGAFLQHDNDKEVCVDDDGLD
jgi:hypothetical protein